MDSQRATWVYAVVPASADRVPGGPAGVADGAVRLVARQELAAVVSSVDRAEVAGALGQEPPDPAWLERAARHHHEVISAFFPGLPTVPFRLGTIYHDDDRVREMLAERAGEFRAALDAVTGRVEWGVRAFPEAPPPEPAGASAGSLAGSLAGAALPGTDYLLRRKAEQSAREQARRAAAAAAQDLDQRLRLLSVAARGHPAHDGETLNMSYLVDNARADEFVRTLRSLDGPSPPLRLHLTGPWPAYSFVGLGELAR